MRNNSDKNIYGIILVDKPKGVTSHDVVDVLRRKLDVKKIGHAGTLDPMATGLLILLVGSATKKQKEFQKYNKVYSGKILFGLETDTWDIEGKILKKKGNLSIDKESIYKLIPIFNGTIIQDVPPYSAVKYKGQTLYKMARKNLAVPVIKRQVSVEWLSYKHSGKELDFRIRCSSGTYVRAIAHQMGKMLSCGACLKELRREQIGEFTLKNSYSLEEIEKIVDKEAYKLFHRL